MDHRKIDNKARVWIVTRAADGSILDQIDPGLLARLNRAHSAKEVADLLAITAGENELDEDRMW